MDQYLIKIRIENPMREYLVDYLNALTDIIYSSEAKVVNAHRQGKQIIIKITGKSQVIDNLLDIKDSNIGQIRGIFKYTQSQSVFNDDPSNEENFQGFAQSPARQNSIPVQVYPR